MTKNKINILITCVGGKFMYDFMACLRVVDGVRIIGADSDPEAQGQLIADKFYTIPMASQDPSAFIEAISNIIKENDIDLFIPSADEEVAVSAEHYDYFTKDLGIKLAFGNPQAVTHVTDKYNLLKSLSENGLYDGDFYLVQGKEEIESALEKLDYPKTKIIAKPRLGRGSRGVFLFDDAVKSFYPFLEHRFCGSGDRDVFFTEMKQRGLLVEDLVLMPYYDGAFYDVDMVAKDGELQDICIRLRQLKNQFSPTSTGHKICMKPEVIEYAAKVCKAVKADGVFDIDVIETPKTMVAIDAAFRFSGSVGASRVAGHNMPAQLVRSVLGLPLERLNVTDHTVLRPFWTMQSIEEDKEGIAL